MSVAVPRQVPVIHKQGKSGGYMHSQQITNRAAYFLMEDLICADQSAPTYPLMGHVKKHKTRGTPIPYFVMAGWSRSLCALALGEHHCAEARGTTF